MMDRLTYYDGIGDACFRWEKPGGNVVIANAATFRLAAYEDTGLTPEEVKELAKAEVERLKEELDELKRFYDKVCEGHYDEVAKLQSENAKLRKVAEAAEKYFYKSCPSSVHYEQLRIDLQQALAELRKDGER